MLPVTGLAALDAGVAAIDNAPTRCCSTLEARSNRGPSRAGFGDMVESLGDTT
ncbi:hypothetical protein [Lichenicola sp.]|uniref:hypothetical protein n=1 Tax=Lichenicola sp. TaxID=2804529 RepID=UPI003B00DF76